MLLKGYHILSMTCLYFAIVSCYTVKDVNTLKTKLLEGYNKHTHPLPGQKLTVKIRVLILSIGDLDEQTEKLSTDMALTISWQDKSMAWDQNDTGIATIEMPSSQVWVPDVFVYNRHHDVSIGSLLRHDLPISYSSSGDGFFLQYLITDTVCDLDMSNFPFDRHICKVEFHVNKWNVTVLAELEEYLLDAFIPDGSWDVTNATIEDFDSETYAYAVMVHIQFKRKPAFVLLNLILPIILLTFLSPMVFLLPNQSGERVAFSVTVLLATSVYMTIISEYVPNTSDPMPLISTMLFISYSFTSIVIIVVIINARIYRIPNTNDVPRILHFLVAVTKCFCRCFRRRNKLEEWETEEEIESLTKTDQPSKQAGRKSKISWKEVSWAIDMVFMILIYAMKFLLVVVFLIILKF